MFGLRLAILALGVFGLLGMTWLFPVLALVLYRGSAKKNRALPMSFDILIPAHNEEASIGRTLAMLKAQIGECAAKFPQIKFSVRVGADSCTDRTAAIAKGFDASTENYSFRSKWKTLCALLKNSQADWVILADAEVQWSDGMLREMMAQDWDSRWMGIAPAFGGGISWVIERHFKRLENRAGGPVSVHGATVFYEREALDQALASLGDSIWLNDDVVIPLMLRSQFRERMIAYWVPPGTASSVSEKARPKGVPFLESFNRRKRLIHGNLEWMSRLLPGTMKKNPVAGILALRRVFRVYWVYWVLFLWMGLAWSSLALFSVLGGALALLILSSSIFTAAVASLLAPFGWVFRRREVKWS